MTTDRAERLHLLIENIREILAKRNQGQELFHNLAALAAGTGSENYASFHFQYQSLCGALRRDVEAVPLKKESVREHWLSCVEALSLTFDVKNLLTRTDQVLGNHYTATNLQALDAMSERLQAVELYETPNDELETALNAIHEAIREMLKAGQLDRRVANVLEHYLIQIETVYRSSAAFGDELFWKTYKEIFGMFIQTHPLIAKLENKEVIFAKIKIAAGKLSSSTISGVSFLANLGTAATIFLPLLASK
ncbi:hypothetical protein FHT87_002651 [Rhizobium sp. BK316]|uniref:hypothetical protein n=1 Tax=Rhizobium sp. BK316 TaxID=2587053 RepID=UPI00160967AA|nr:hypothetical protein [Rhizobium sp. BK316]MBB3408748.1 hypothetical protein [Rhizobium sp. BK316]